MENTERKLNDGAIVLLSGGQDSTTSLYWAKAHFKEVVALNLYYGQRHKIEIESARKIAGMAGVPFISEEISIIGKIGDSALVDNINAVNDVHHHNKNLPASFVPGRNLLLLTIASMYAYKYDFPFVVPGICQTDYSGYPDCREETIIELQSALRLGMEFPVSIVAPLLNLTKAESINMAGDFAGCMEALAYSHTCYNGSVPPCGECNACKIRAKGFSEAGITDPLIKRITEDLA